jgi:transposase
MARGRPKAQLELSDGERRALEGYARRRKISHQLALRSQMVLLCARGLENKVVAEKLGVHAVTVGKWRARFVEKRLDGLFDEPRPGVPRTVTDEQVEEVLRLTLETTPRGATHWSSRKLAKKVGLSFSTVQRIWRAFSLQPHRVETFKLSNDPLFVEKVRDIVGLYLNPPEHALVLCLDEKSQIQALDRSQPLLPLRPGQPERRTHDYRRNGITSLFAALDIATGRVIGKTYRRHRAVEFRKFLNEIDRAVPGELEIHLVLDNLATHKTPVVRRWFERHPRFHVHFTPTYSSWLNQIERWFALLTEQQLRRGIHPSVWALEQDIREFIETTNQHPKPFQWTKPADAILDSLSRFCQRTLHTHAPEKVNRISDSGH